MIAFANTGIDKYTVLALTKCGAQLGMIYRSRAKGESAQAEIKFMSGNEHVDLLIADMSAEKYTDQYITRGTSRRVLCHRVAEQTTSRHQHHWPFTETTVLIARTCLSHSHYIDLANDVISVSALLDRHDEAVVANCTSVTGVGFGMLASESVAMKLCQERPIPDRVRTDALASAGIEAGVFGEALAATIIDGLFYCGLYYKNGRLMQNRVGSSLINITTPDGSCVTAASVPFGELVAARRASRATNVLAVSNEVPTGPAIRAILPLAMVLSHIKPLRTFAKHRLACVKFSDRKRPREYSWGHASVQWSDRTNQEGWLRTGDAMDFTSAVVTEVT